MGNPYRETNKQATTDRRQRADALRGDQVTQETHKPAASNPLRFAERKLTAQQLADGIEDYFKDCETRNRKPTKPGLCNFLGISTSTWDNWMREGEGKAVKRSLKCGETGESRYNAYIWPMKKALQRMTDELEQRVDTMALFLLKQPSYGGYTDKAGENPMGGNLAVTISFGEVHKNTARNYGK